MPRSRPHRSLELQLDEEARTAQVVWEWTEPGWREPSWGDVDRLPSGHVLVTKAHSAFFSFYPDSRTELVEVDPADGVVVWRLTVARPDLGGYRAERIDGCALFANESLCG